MREWGFGALDAASGVLVSGAAVAGAGVLVAVAGAAAGVGVGSLSPPHAASTRTALASSAACRHHLENDCWFVFITILTILSSTVAGTCLRLDR